ncbi:MAG: hypothetical protein A4E19_18000 [Nitrospira sp. SG-bin1]|nr:MAG: hypothetical protein A4E19_18000 [Nitrospira sp. SG-bin1]
MSTQKPRKQVADIGSLNPLVPQADPRTQDSYVRPGAPDIERPSNANNPYQKLADALSVLNKDLLQPMTAQAAQQYTAKEYADAEKSFWENREKANEMIRSGEFPAGASPYWQRGLQRASLKQHGQLLAAQLHQDFLGEAGAEARASNDPRVVQSFADKVIQQYSQENLRAGDRSLYSALDLQEIFHPAIEQASKSLLSTHATYRVQENQQQYVDLAGATIETLLEQHLGELQATDDDEERSKAYREAGAKINDVFYNFDTGLVKNGFAPSKGNQLIVDTITAKAMKTGDRSFLDVLDHVPAGNGASVGKTQYAQAKRLQAEEHITQIQMQQERHRWSLEDRPHEVASKQRQEEDWKKQDERWLRERASWELQDAGRAEHEILRSLTRRVYEGLRRSDSKAGVSIINEAIRSAETMLPEKAEQLRDLVDQFTKHKVDFPEDDLAIAKLRAKISIDPLSVKPADITALLKNREAKRLTVMGLYDDLDRAVAHADHPYLRQTEFSEMLHQVQRGAMQSPEDEFSAQGQLRVANATASFRDRAQDWITTHPQGNISAFREHMRAQVAPVIELANREYGIQQDAERKQQADKGKMIVDKTKAAIAERDAKQAQAAEVERKKQEREAQLKQQREIFNQNFKPSGKKTSDGRDILVSPTGAIASEQTITIHGVPEINNGGVTNIPTIFGGKKYSDEEAIEIMRRNKGVDPDTGKKPRRWWSISDAEIAAREKSNRLGQEYGQQSKK